jgi:hypothetical protein
MQPRAFVIENGIKMIKYKYIKIKMKKKIFKRNFLPFYIDLAFPSSLFSRIEKELHKKV